MALSVLLMTLLGAGIAPLTAAVTEPATAAGTGQLTEQRKKTEEEKASLAQEQAQLEAQREQFAQQRANLRAETITALQVQEQQLAVDLARVRLDAASLDRQGGQRQLEEAQAAVTALEDKLARLAAAAKPGDPAHEAKLAAMQAELAQGRERLALLKTALDNMQARQGLASQRLNLQQEWLSVLNGAYQQHQAQSRRGEFQDLEQRLNRERESWLSKAAEWREQQRTQSADAGEVEKSLLDTRIKQAEEMAFVRQAQLEIARIQVHYEQLLEQSATADSEGLQGISSELTALHGQLLPMDNLLATKLSLIQQQQQLNDKRGLLEPLQQKSYQATGDILAQMKTELAAQLANLRSVLAGLGASQANVQQAYLDSLRQGLRSRHKLPRTLEVWKPVLHEMMAVPVLLLRVVQESLTEWWGAVRTSDDEDLTLLLGLLLLWSGAWYWLRRQVSHWRGILKGLQTQESFSVRAGLFFANFWLAWQYVWLGTIALLLSLFVVQLAQPANWILLWLVGLLFASAILVALARWLLVGEVVAPISRRQDLYRGFRLTVIIAALFTALVTVAHLGMVSAPVREMTDRLFLTFLIVPGVLSLRLRSYLILLLEVHARNNFWYATIRFSTLAVPLLLFVAALLGAVGYINLAWYVSAHLAWFVLVFAGWLVVVSLLRDLTNLAKNFVNLHTDKGLVWAKGVIEPVHYFLFMVSLASAIILLFTLFGWGSDSVILQAIRHMLDYPLMQWGDTTIDFKHVAGTVLLLVAVVFGAHWVRQFTYRWLYSGVVDLGIRNSLSVFTQYAFVLIGLLVALNILGVDLTSLAIFAGALGVGIGFGLQNIANNFISGLILLAERPLRANDWVTIGTNEGEVKRIGIRSVTVTTWDNQDVVIPNAEIVSTPFINWTLSDNIVRTVIFMGVSYHDDPHRTIEVIREAVHSHPAVLPEPECRVWLREFGNSSVDFRIHYHIDVHQHSRLEVKSEVMLKIWDALKREGITIPFPQQDIYIKEMPADMLRGADRQS